MSVFRPQQRASWFSYESAPSKPSLESLLTHEIPGDRPRRALAPAWLVLLPCLAVAALSLSCGGSGSLTQANPGAGIEAPSLNLSPLALSFGNQAVGASSSAQSVTLSNSGSTALTVSNIAVSDDFAQTNNCGGSVAAGSGCTIRVVFAPVGGGAHNGTISITDDATGSPQSVTLSGTGITSSPTADVTPTALTFTSQAVGAASAAQTVTLSNTGSANLTVSSVALSGANASDFAQSSTCGGSVAAGGNCAISVRFTPSASGARSGALTISDNASGGSQTIALTGTGSGPVDDLSTSSLSFATQPVGTTSGSQPVTLTNAGNATLGITSITVTGDFQQTNTCGTAVAAGGTCIVGVTFAPTTEGTRSGTITVVDNAPGSPHSVSLSGSGGATAPAVGFAPTSLTFSGRLVGSTSPVQTATLTNTGNATLNISTIAVTGTNAGDFSQTTTCGTSVSAGASCTVSVIFTPLAAGSRSASISVADNAGGSPQTIALAGTGNAASSAVTLTPSSLTFTNQPVATTSSVQVITLQNTGNAALAISGVALTGVNAADFAQTNTCGSSVAAGANCTISVTFTPTASGARAASVAISDNAAGSPHTASLGGVGTAPSLTFSPASLSFGSQTVGTTGAARAITLTNNGNGALSVSGIAISGTNAADFAQTNTCGNSVAAGASCTVSVTFDPAASGNRTASLSVADNAAGSPQTAGLSGSGSSGAPTVTFTPSTLPLGNQAVATASSPQTITLKNAGTSALNISSVAFTGANAADFSQNNTCGSSVAAGGSCAITVMFTPSGCGSESASLSVTDNATGSPHTVPVSGTGSHDVILTWTDGPSSTIVGYNIYRGTATNGEASAPLNSTPVAGSAFADTGVAAGGTYYYLVKGVDSSGVVQESSNEASATVPAS